MNLRMQVTTRPADITAAWVSVAWRAGLILGGVFVGSLAVYGKYPLPAVLFAVVFGAVLGLFIAVFVGLITGAVLALLAGPLALWPGRRFARTRAAVVAVAATELGCLPVQAFFAPEVPLTAMLVPTIPSLLTAAIVATRISPAGRVDTPDAVVQVVTR
jgi:hypothetical protein